MKLKGIFKKTRYKNKPVLVIRVLLHMQSTQPLGLIDEGPLFALAQSFPFGAQPLGDLRVVHFGVLLSHFPPLASGPHHKSVHRPFDAVRIVLVVRTPFMPHFNVVIMRRCGARHFTTGPR